MGGEGLALDSAVEVVPAQRLQAVGVQGVGQPVLLHRQELARVHHHIGVGQGAVLAGHRRVVGEGVAVLAEQGAASGLLQGVLLGAHEADPEIHSPAAEAEHRHHPVAVVVDVVAVQGRMPEVRAAAVEGPCQALGNLAVHLQVLHLALDAHGRVEAGEGRGLREAHVQRPAPFSRMWMFFSWVKVSSSARLSSRPRPDCL